MPAGVQTRSRSRAKSNTLAMENIRMDSFMPGTDDAGLWISRFEHYIKLKGWTPEQAATAIPLYLQGNAMLWYEALSEATKQNAAEVKRHFLDRFEKRSVGQWREKEIFFTKKQGIDESVEEFCETVHRLAKDLNKTEDDIKDVIIRGLTPQIRQFVLTREHDTLTDVMRNARIAQSLGPTNDTTLSEIHSKINSLESKIDNQFSKLCSLEPENYRGHSHQGSAYRSPHRNSALAASRWPSPKRVSFDANTAFQRGSLQHHQPRQWDRSRSSRDARPPPPSAQWRNQASQRPLHTHTSQAQTTCRGCGEYSHNNPNHCRARGKRCYFCGKLNHIAKVCMSAKRNFH